MILPRVSILRTLLARCDAHPRLRLLLTAACAALGGAIASALHVPLPWMLGAMAATGLLAWFDRAAVAAPTRPTALLLLGLGLGQTFTTPVIAALAVALPWLLVAAVISILVGILVARIFARAAGTDPKTSYFATVPGGVIVMAVLAQRAGVSVAPVSLAQTIRVMVVVAVVPPLITWLAPRGGAGAFFAERPEVWLPGLAFLLAAGLGVALVIRALRLANPWMLGPCGLVILLSAFGSLPSGVPLWMIDVAQIGMGMALGARMSRSFLLSSKRLALASVAGTLLMVAVLAALGVGLGLVSGLPVGAAILGMAPGGMPEMTITAKALDVGVPLVLGFHLVRTLACNLLVGPAWTLMEKLRLDR
jgi:membrane AbrB-like protein